MNSPRYSDSQQLSLFDSRKQIAKVIKKQKRVRRGDASSYPGHGCDFSAV